MRDVGKDMSKANVPDTSTTLLRDLAASAENARWAEFVARYRPMMEAYLRTEFPDLDADEIVQETLIALVGALSNYTYDPDEKGHFHNYLTGILRRRALKAKQRDARRSEVLEDYGKKKSGEPSAAEQEEKNWRESLYEIALQQLLADKTVQGRTKQVFVRTVINREKPEAVAAAFRIERNAVDQIRSRMMGKLRKLVAVLEKADTANLK